MTDTQSNRIRIANPHQIEEYTNLLAKEFDGQTKVAKEVVTRELNNNPEATLEEIRAKVAEYLQDQKTSETTDTEQPKPVPTKAEAENQ